VLGKGGNVLNVQEHADLFTIDEAARCIMHRQTGLHIRAVTLRAWIAEARRTGSHPQFQDERALQKEGIVHRLRREQIEALLIGRPYLFVRPEARGQIQDDAAMVAQLTDALQTLQQDYQSLLELLHRLRAKKSQPGRPHRLKQVSSEDRYGENSGQVREYVPLREHWVGRGDCQGYFALFVHVYGAHGFGKSRAGHRSEKAKQDLLQGLSSSSLLTVIPAGAKGSGDRLVVTEQQASQLIIDLHFEVCLKARSRDVPALAVCRDPRCPVCPHIASGVEQTLGNVIEVQP
jgi:hypothetical protein